MWPAAAAIPLALIMAACRGHQDASPAAAQRAASPSQTSREAPPILCSGGDTVPVPFRDRYPALSNRYRLRGVHYFQGRWPYTFWDSLRVAQLDRDFREIHSYGFNTIVLFLGWGNFQTRISPPTYDEDNFKKLDTVIEAARRNNLWVVLRVGTPEAVPKDLPGSRPYEIPDLMFESQQIDAVADLFLTVSRHVARYDNVFGLFNSWEDFSQYLNMIRQDPKTRLDFENRKGVFRAYLRARGSLENWNQKWGTSYARFEDIPLPASGEPALADYVDMIAHYINEAILTKIHTSGNVGLGYELRLDKEPVKAAGQTTWHGYEAGYQLPPQFTFIAAYYNPFWGAPNDGGFTTPDFAATMAQRMLHEILSNSKELPIFVEQLNLADDTPRFTRTNSKLRYPADEAEAVRRILPVLFRRTIGYSLWTHRDYAANMLADSAFLANTGVWTASRPLAYATRPDGEKEALFVPGQRVEQTIVEPFNPGKVSDALYRFDLTAALPSGASTPAEVNLIVTSPDGKRAEKALTVMPGPAHRYSVLLPEIGIKTASLHLQFETPANNRSPVQVAEVRLWNHVMATGVVDEDGRPRRSRVFAYQSPNQAWNCVERGEALPAAYATASTAESCTDCSGLFEDGWVGQTSVLPVYVPFTTSQVTLEAFLPESLSGAEGLQVQVQWMDAPRGTPPIVQKLKPGLNAIQIPVPPTDSILGDRTLIVRANKTFRASGDLRDLVFRLVRYGNLSIKPLPLGSPAEGDFATAIPQPDANRLLVNGRVDGAGSGFIVTVEPRGHAPQEFTIAQAGDFHIAVALWAERLSGKPEVFIRVSRLSGTGRLTISSLTGENERTPNTVYR